MTTSVAYRDGENWTEHPCSLLRNPFRGLKHATYSLVPPRIRGRRMLRLGTPDVFRNRPRLLRLFILRLLDICRYLLISHCFVTFTVQTCCVPGSNKGEQPEVSRKIAPAPAQNTGLRRSLLWGRITSFAVSGHSYIKRGTVPAFGGFATGFILSDFVFHVGRLRGL